MSEPNSYQRVILLALNKLNRHIYGGTVTAAEKTKRRKANRVASASRRTNRK